MTRVQQRGGRGVILGRRETYTDPDVDGLNRHDLRLLAMELQVPGAERWCHGHYWLGMRWSRTRAQMLAAIKEAIQDAE